MCCHVQSQKYVNRNECFVSAQDTQVLTRHSLKAGVGVDNDHGVVWTWDFPISKIRSCPRFQLQLTTVATQWEWSSVSHRLHASSIRASIPQSCLYSLVDGLNSLSMSFPNWAYLSSLALTHQSEDGRLQIFLVTTKVTFVRCSDKNFEALHSDNVTCP